MEKVRSLAFYLPQYHEIPENNEWWGKGFTEWTNVKKAKPLFEGHYQPHLPHEDIGFYNLLEPGIKKLQAEMARKFGIDGFCYYHYWFHGKQLLEKPLKQILESGKPDFPFCVCWANETWSRRWDGQDHEILIEQKFSSDDDIAFIKNLIPYFKDKRYIKVNGRPLLLVWRSEKIPDPKATVKRWQSEMRKVGLPDPYLVRVESHMINIDPKYHGFDAAVDFAPNSSSIEVVEYNKRPKDAPSSLNIYDYLGTMYNLIPRINAKYKRFQGIFISWDNCARKKINGSVYINDSLGNFKYVLSRVVKNTLEKFSGDERLIFINAWNEWAEGCHLEPDVKNGYAYLNACKKVLLDGEYEIGKNEADNEYLKWLQDKNYSLKRDCFARQVECEKIINKMRKLKQDIGVMKNSKFWKLRELYLKIKNLFK